MAVLVVVAHLEWEESEIEVEATEKPASENKLSTTGETPVGAECLETLFFREWKCLSFPQKFSLSPKDKDSSAEEQMTLIQQKSNV